MKLIDYENPDELGAVRSICIGCLTANVGAIVSLTLIDQHPADLQSALVSFAASLPLLGSCATAFDRAITSLAAGRPLAKWPAHLVTFCTLVALFLTNRGYVLFMGHYSEKAMWAYLGAMTLGVVMMLLVQKHTKRK
jgi:hypothetical protein